MFTSISRFCGAEVVTTFVSICQGIRRPRRGFEYENETRQDAPGRGTRAPRGTPGYARNNERNKPRAIVPGRLYHVRVRASARGHSGNGGPSPRAVPRPNRKAGRTGSRTRPGGLGETARSRVPRVWRRRDPTLHIRRDRAPRAPRSPLCTVWVIRYSHSLGRPTARFHTRYDVAHGARRARARAARMLARRTAVMDAVLFADHRECAPRPILEIAWCV